MESTLLNALHKGLTTEQTTFYCKTNSGKGIMITTVPCDKVRLLYVAWDPDRKLASEDDPVINPYLIMCDNKSYLTYAGFYVPEEKTLFAEWHLFQNICYELCPRFRKQQICYCSASECKEIRQTLLQHAKDELDFTVMWVADGVDAFNSEYSEKLEAMMVGANTHYSFTDKEYERIATAYREYLMGVAMTENALEHICMSLGFKSRLINANEADLIDYYAGRATVSNLSNHFEDIYAKRCECERISKHLLESGKLITAQEQSFVDAIRPTIDNHIKACLEQGIPVTTIPVVISFKDGLRLKSDLLALRRYVCNRCPLYYTGVTPKYYIEDVKTVNFGHNLDLLGAVAWENDS